MEKTMLITQILSQNKVMTPPAPEQKTNNSFQQVLKNEVAQHQSLGKEHEHNDANAMRKSGENTGMSEASVPQKINKEKQRADAEDDTENENSNEESTDTSNPSALALNLNLLQDIANKTSAEFSKDQPTNISLQESLIKDTTSLQKINKKQMRSGEDSQAALRSIKGQLGDFSANLALQNQLQAKDANSSDIATDLLTSGKQGLEQDGGQFTSKLSDLASKISLDGQEKTPTDKLAKDLIKPLAASDPAVQEIGKLDETNLRDLRNLANHSNPETRIAANTDGKVNTDLASKLKPTKVGEMGELSALESSQSDSKSVAKSRGKSSLDFNAIGDVKRAGADNDAVQNSRGNEKSLAIQAPQNIDQLATPNTQVQQLVVNEIAKNVASSDYVAARVGSPTWGNALGQKITWMVAGGEQSAQLTLNPPDLGPLQVVLSISNSQVDASFVSSHLDVREAISAAAPQLREMLDSAGIALAGFSVSAQAHSGQAFQSPDAPFNFTASRPAAPETRLQGIDKLQTSIQERTNQRSGSVDTFV